MVMPALLLQTRTSKTSHHGAALFWLFKLWDNENICDLLHNPVGTRQILVATSQPKIERLINVSLKRRCPRRKSNVFSKVPPLTWLQRRIIDAFLTSFPQRRFNRRDINVDTTSYKRGCFDDGKINVIATSKNQSLFNFAPVTLTSLAYYQQAPYAKQVGRFWDCGVVTKINVRMCSMGKSFSTF